MRIGPPEPDVSTWEGRMMMRTSVRRTIRALTDPPEPEPDEPPAMPYGWTSGWGTADVGNGWTITGGATDFSL